MDGISLFLLVTITPTDASTLLPSSTPNARRNGSKLASRSRRHIVDGLIILVEVKSISD